MDKYPVLGDIDADLQQVERELPKLAVKLGTLLAMAVDLEADMRFANRDYLGGDDAATWSSELDAAA